jgi:hypothetical protein
MVLNGYNTSQQTKDYQNLYTYMHLYSYNFQLRSNGKESEINPIMWPEAVKINLKDSSSQILQQKG